MLVKTIGPDPDGPNGPQTSPITQTVYDSRGNQVETIDPLGRKTFYVYDALNQLVSMIAPDPDGPSGPLESPVTMYGYDALGQQVTVIDPLGNITRTIYDSQGRVIETIQPDPDGSGGQ